MKSQDDWGPYYFSQFPGCIKHDNSRPKVERFVEGGPGALLEPSPRDVQGMDFGAVFESDLYHEHPTISW